MINIFYVIEFNMKFEIKLRHFESLAKWQTLQYENDHISKFSSLILKVDK